MKAMAVIGAAFGDEGKGHVVDYLCEDRPNLSTVVRFNGGAQAGHTVELANGQRHVFHHFGSGTLRGAATHLSEFFIVNPLLWKKEWKEIPTTGHSNTMHYDCPLTTPYDMLVNQEAEQARGSARHGSCGAGVNETVTRNEIPKYRTTASDLIAPSVLKHKLETIRDYYAVRRLVSLTALPPSETFMERLNSDRILEDYLAICKEMLERYSFQNYTGRSPKMVFEGAQGLLLDEKHWFFPHVTRSRTGLRNVITILQREGINELDVYYVMRTYMTRHGVGSFPTEDLGMSFPDATNVDNRFQGVLRFGKLDYELIRQAITMDLGCVPPNIKVRAGIALNHVDQHAFSPTTLIHKVEKELELPVVLLSHGPCRENIIRTDHELKEVVPKNDLSLV